MIKGKNVGLGCLVKPVGKQYVNIYYYIHLNRMNISIYILLVIEQLNAVTNK